MKKKSATKARVVEAMRGSDVVHLATHGEPEGLFFAGTSAAEATLSMAEVHALELRRTKLVVLSACDTFKGELRSDGVVGITRAFVAAGAPTLVASLWKVDDAATLDLMRRFYRELLEDKDGDVEGNAAVALRKAMLWMIKGTAKRSFSVLQWAAFVVYGLAEARAQVERAAGNGGGGNAAAVASVAAAVAALAL